MRRRGEFLPPSPRCACGGAALVEVRQRLCAWGGAQKEGWILSRCSSPLHQIASVFVWGGERVCT